MKKLAKTPNETDQFSELLGIDEFQAPVPVGEDSKTLVPVDPEDYIERLAKGRGGRPRGRVDNRKGATKTAVMQQRLALEAGLRDYIAHPNRRKMLRDALDRILRIAAYGLEDKDAVRAWGVISDKLMSPAKQEEEASQSKNTEIKIVIENATVKALPVIEGEIIQVKD